MANYAILRFSKRQAGGVASADRHNERKKEKYKSNPDIDPERSYTNYHLVQPEGTYKQECMKRIRDAGCKVRSNSVVMVETLITATPEFIKAMDPEKQRQFFEHALDFISSNVGKQNIVSAIVHMDETTPHMHLVFCPITPSGKLSAKEILGNRQSMSEWQDRFYEHMSRYYRDLSRGLPGSVTGRKHIPSYLFKQAAELSKSYEILEKLEHSNILNIRSVRKDAMHEISRMIRICSSLAGKAKDVDDQIDKLERAVRDRDAIINKRESVSDQLELLKLQQRLKELQSWQEKAQTILDRIPKDMLDGILYRTDNHPNKGKETMIR